MLHVSFADDVFFAPRERRSLARSARAGDRSLALGVKRLHLALGLPVPVLRGEERRVGSASGLNVEKRVPLRLADIFPSHQGVGAAGCRGPAIARRGSGFAGLEAYLPDSTGDEAEAQADSGLRGHVHLGSCAWTGRGEVVRCGRAWDEDENESSRVSVERRCGRVPSETRAPRVRERVRTVAEVLNRRHVVRCACAACVEVLAPEQHRAENKNRRSLFGPEWHGAGRGQRTTKSTSKSFHRCTFRARAGSYSVASHASRSVLYFIQFCCFACCTTTLTTSAISLGARLLACLNRLSASPGLPISLKKTPFARYPRKSSGWSAITFA